MPDSVHERWAIASGRVRTSELVGSIGGSGGETSTRSTPDRLAGIAWEESGSWHVRAGASVEEGCIILLLSLIGVLVLLVAIVVVASVVAAEGVVAVAGKIVVIIGGLILVIPVLCWFTFEGAYNCSMLQLHPSTWS